MSTLLKKKGPAEAATSPSHGSTNPTKDMDMNTHTDSTDAAPAASEDAPLKVIRLAKEISTALNDCETYEVVVVYPSRDREYPVAICLDRDYRQMTNAMFAYRDAVLAFGSSGGKGLRKLRAERDRAHEDLMASFYEAFDAGGAA